MTLFGEGCRVLCHTQSFFFEYDRFNPTDTLYIYAHSDLIRNYWLDCFSKYCNNDNDDNIETNGENTIDLEECKKLTIKIEKIFILAFLLSFILYCLIIFLSVPKY